MTDLPCPKAVSTHEAFNLHLERQAMFILPRQTGLRRIGQAMASAMGHAMQRHLDRYVARSPNQASAARRTGH